MFPISFLSSYTKIEAKKKKKEKHIFTALVAVYRLTPFGTATSGYKFAYVRMKQLTQWLQTEYD